MAFTYYTPLTIDHTKVPNTDQTNFPVGILITSLARLAVIGSGGHVESSSGFDIRPYSDSALTSAMTYQLVSYTSTTGLLEMYVLVSSLSHTADTVIYLAYGDAALTTDGSSTSTWNSAFKYVGHMGNATTLSGNDSTSAAANLSGVNTPTRGASLLAGGNAGSSVSCVRASTQYLNGTIADPGVTLTLECFINPTAVNVTQEIVALTNSNGASGCRITLASTVPRYTLAAVADYDYSTLTAASATRQYFAFTASGNGGTGIAYFAASGAGSLSSESKAIGTRSGTPNTLTVGNGTTINGENFGGLIDEVRVSNAVRSADWLTTTFNNLDAPSTFYATGSEVAVGSSPKNLPPGLFQPGVL